MILSVVFNAPWQPVRYFSTKQVPCHQGFCRGMTVCGDCKCLNKRQLWEEGASNRLLLNSHRNTLRSVMYHYSQPMLPVAKCFNSSSSALL